MWKKFVKDYLTFTKKDRIGVIVLLMLIFIVVLLPHIWPAKQNVPPPAEEIAKIKLLAAQLNKTDRAVQEKEGEDFAYHYPAKKNSPREKAEVFYFDPNTLNTAGWKRLGIRDKTTTTIQNYLAKGGKFKRPEDISKIYGLFKDDYERLLPYVKISGQPASGKKYKEEKREYTTDKPVSLFQYISAPAIVDINTADTTAFIALPGIGSKLAARIVHFRDKLGGFYEVQQLAETYGLPDAAFHEIKPLLRCSNPSLRQININTADVGTLQQHPYIRWNLANAIVQYRGQHGNFKSVDHLEHIALVTPEILQKIRPYMVVQ